MKIESCPRCGMEPCIWHYQDIDTEASRYAIQHRCDKDKPWIEIYTRTALGAILKFNRWARRERRRMKKEAGEK